MILITISLTRPRPYAKSVPAFRKKLVRLVDQYTNKFTNQGTFEFEQGR